MIGLLPILPLVTFFSQPASDVEIVSAPLVAQVRLAETLADADAIESVTAHPNARAKTKTNAKSRASAPSTASAPSSGSRAVTFVIVRGGETFDVTAKTTKSGEIVSLAIARAHQRLPVQLHGLTWLGNELSDVAAVTRLVVDEEGGVMIGTDDGRRYMAIPGRGSAATNVAAEARWAATWAADDS